ncbi:nuclear transport factor 2 family protein [Streptomyces sp. NPDC049813]|uniref:nuclear transport factor 2 family protein n=1 Tax=Streptomyces sp. NPDC049813 TaxID=3365597 RepID=UPI0037897EFB
MTTTLMHEFYRLVDSGDVPGLVDLFTPDAVYHRPGYPPVHGRSGMRHFYTHTRKIREGRHELDAVVVSGDEVAVRGSFAGVLHDGTPAKHRFAEFFTVTADHRISRRETFFATPLV